MAIAARTDAPTVCDRRLLWRFGISGDRPIVLVSAGVDAGPGPAALAGAGAAPVVLGRRRLRPGGGQRRAGVVPDGRCSARSPRCASATQPTSAAQAGPRRAPAFTCCARRTVGRRAEHAARAGAGAPARRRPAAAASRAGLGRAARGAPSTCATTTSYRDAGERAAARRRRRRPREGRLRRRRRASSASTSARGCGRCGRGSTCWPIPTSAPRSRRPVAATPGP